MILKGLCKIDIFGVILLFLFFAFLFREWISEVSAFTIKTFFMLSFLEQKDLYDRILRLGEKEQQDPAKVIERFFSDYRLHECRHYLWMMVETCFTTDNTSFSEPEERANLLLRVRSLEELLEAGYLLSKKKG